MILRYPHLLFSDIVTLKAINHARKKKLNGRLKLKKTLLIALAFLLSLPVNSYGQSTNRYCEQTRLLLNTLEKKHYQPIPVGEELSQRAYQLFVHAIDPHSLYFIASDTVILATCKTDMIQGADNQSCISIFGSICKLYHQRLSEADTLISQILQNPMSFTAKDSIHFDENEKISFANDKQTLKKGWVKWLKYEALMYLFSPDSSNDMPFAKSSQVLLLKEPEIRNKIKIKEKRYIDRIFNHSDGFDNYVASAFFNAIATSFDPHSAYFSATEKSNFESSLSVDELSYGFEVEDDPNGNVQISRLVPGGPAWKSNELHKGDILTLVHWPDGQTVDLTSSDEDEVEEILHSSSSDRMELTVKKPNGQLKTVTLIKKVLKADDNLIKSFVLKGEKNIGYISLPGFYTEWENEDPAGCSNDMAKEIIKLKLENVEGIIIDLRNNGGGALSEAITLAGTFIDNGPLCILSERNKKLTLLRDMSLGTVYDGPLILMVNGFSASASEVLAASLQDYHRALIVGSTTFGKATGQIIFPLDSAAKVNDKEKANGGFVKITTSKFYRLDGVSYQRKGVVPDVILPAYFEELSTQEATQPFAFASDSVTRKVHYTPLPTLPVKELSEKSKTRLAANEKFKKVSLAVDSLKSVMKQLKEVPITIESFRKKEAWIFKAIQILSKDIEQPSLSFKVTNVRYDQYLMNLSTYRKEVNDILVKNLQNDIYIDETYQVMKDLIGGERKTSTP